MVRHHTLHVLCSKEIRNSSKSLSGLECKMVIGFSVLWGQFGIIKSLWEEMMNKGTEGESIRPGVGEVLYFHIIILPSPALAPDQNSLHLGGHHLDTLSRGSENSEFQGNTSMSGHTSFLAVWVEAGGGVLCLLDETGHVLEEQIVHVLLIHVLQLQGRPAISLCASHCDV